MIASSPLDDGSGKFGTPCVRMQLENLSRDDGALAAAPDFDDDPQAASSSAAAATLTAIAKLRRARGETTGRFYVTVGNTGITSLCRGYNRPRQAATAESPIPITFSRRDSAR